MVYILEGLGESKETVQKAIAIERWWPKIVSAIEIKFKISFGMVAVLYKFNR